MVDMLVFVTALISPCAPVSDPASGVQPGTSAAATSGQLAEEVKQAVALIRPLLPIRQDDIAITNVEGNGTELVYHMEVPDDLDAAAITEFRQLLPQQACSDPQAVEFFRRGGKWTYQIRDGDGQRFTLSIDRC